MSQDRDTRPPPSFKHVLIKAVGTYEEYDKIDPETV